MANKSAILVLAFDIYGTLLDTNNITLGIQTHIGLAADKAAQLSQTWRKYQLEYTWRLNSMGLYEPFNVVTRKSLQHAAAELELTLDDKTIAALVDAYSHLLPVVSQGRWSPLKVERLRGSALPDMIARCPSCPDYIYHSLIM
ncbi:hypothetical protein AcW1_009836 [Taiwanofungus camphoratus]|nr:hypothetical protein AcW1_009836 [Antrodia cinnamomea]